jgi:hypothetical protein
VIMLLSSMPNQLISRQELYTLAKKRLLHEELVCFVAESTPWLFHCSLPCSLASEDMNTWPVRTTDGNAPELTPLFRLPYDPVIQMEVH